MKKYIKSLIFSLSTILLSLFITTILNYFNIINKSIFNIISIIFVIISLFICGYIIGKNSNSKGWLNGLKGGSAITLIFLIISLIFKSSVNFKMIIYYIAILAISTIGGMIGINKKG